MKKIVDVIVIGTDPPCPRCDMIDILVTKAAPSNLAVHLQHLAFDSTAAKNIGKRFGRKVGTAKHVAHGADIPMDWDAVYGLIETKRFLLPKGSRPADTWTPDLDSMLEPCQQAAKSQGYLMTPILIVNDKVVHYGSVPSLDQVAAWLSEGIIEPSVPGDA